MRATVVSILMIALSAPMLAQSPPATEFVTVDVTTVGVGMETGAHVVVLHDRTSDKTMPVWIGTAEAQAIARSLYDIVPPRPMTHDLLRLLLDFAKAATLLTPFVRVAEDAARFAWESCIAGVSDRLDEFVVRKCLSDAVDDTRALVHIGQTVTLIADAFIHELDARRCRVIVDRLFTPRRSLWP